MTSYPRVPLTDPAAITARLCAIGVDLLALRAEMARGCWRADLVARLRALEAERDDLWFALRRARAEACRVTRVDE